MSNKSCLICEEPMVARPPGYWFECLQCHFMASTLEPQINADAPAIDEALRHQALHELRQANYARILSRLKSLSPTAGSRLLDVGSAHGWFLKAAEAAGFEALGIEPDRQMAQQAMALGCNVRIGEFPQAALDEPRVSIITFLDVFEHLSDLPSVLNACRETLLPRGLLLIVLPSSRGIFFRAARALSRLGVHGPLDRLWQRGFPSPHASYFHQDNLSRFLSRHGWSEIHRQALPSLTQAGLWQRLHYDRRANRIVSAAQYALLSVAMPGLSLLPSDISFQIFQLSEPTS